MKVWTVYGNKQYSTKASAHKMMLIPGNSVVALLYTYYYNWVWCTPTNTPYCSEQQLKSEYTCKKSFSWPRMYLLLEFCFLLFHFWILLCMALDYACNLTSDMCIPSSPSVLSHHHEHQHQQQHQQQLSFHLNLSCRNHLITLGCYSGTPTPLSSCNIYYLMKTLTLSIKNMYYIHVT